MVKGAAFDEIYNIVLCRLGGVMVYVLVITPMVRGFQPGRCDENPQHAFFRRASEVGSPML